MSYLYFGSKWGEDKKQLIKIFLKYNIVFAGLDSKEEIFNYEKYDIGTKIAVTDGFTIKAVAETIEKFTSLDKLSIDFTKEELSNFKVGDWVLAVKVKLYELEEKDWGWYDAALKRVDRIIKREDIKEFIDNRLKKYSGELAMEEYIKLLQNNYNLILTGAPGTGKTYLAKQIAAKIIFNKEYTEEFEEDENFKNQCRFVQFHPSYDYTDFVEGLRPIKDDNGNICFERKDGVFKEFCKKALKNLIDSNKEILELNKDAIIKNKLTQFIDYVSNIIETEESFKIDGINRKAAPLKEIELNDDEILYFIPDITSNIKISLKLDKLVDFYKRFAKVFDINKKWDYKNFINEFGKGNHTYKYGFLKAFFEKYNPEIEKELKNVKNGTTTVEKVERKNFVFIIDEINRGEISKIFGELFFAVDPGYRGIKGKVLTQYSNLIDEEEEKYFYIPENVYIIGTMNDIDRSVESMDFAMRRRFAFKEIKAKDTQENILKSLDGSIKQEAIDRMNNLNKVIEEIEDFNSSYHIGASYFLKLENYYKNSNDDKETAFKSLWENHLKGLLFEYLRGMPDAESKLKKLENAYNNKVLDNNATQDSSTEQDSDEN